MLPDTKYDPEEETMRRTKKTFAAALALTLAAILTLLSVPTAAFAEIYEVIEEEIVFGDPAGGEEEETQTPEEDEDFEDNVVLVTFRKEYSSPDFEVDKDVFPELDVDRIDNLAIADKDENFTRNVVIYLREHDKDGVVRACEKLSERDDLLYVSPSYIITATADEINDPAYAAAKQYGGYNNTAYDAINVPEVWDDITSGSKYVKVAVMDTQVDDMYYDSGEGRLLYNDFFDKAEYGPDEKITGNLAGKYIIGNSTSDHGTAVASVIGAKGNNGRFSRGVCCDVSLVSIGMLSDTGRNGSEVFNYSTSDIHHSLDIMKRENISIANFCYGTYERDDSTIVNGSPYYNGWNSLADWGGLFVTSAGNGSRDADTRKNEGASKGDCFRYPQHLGYDENGDELPDNRINKIVVAAYNENGDANTGGRGLLQNESNYGKKTVDVAAPGAAIYVLSGRDNTEYSARENSSGTSVATPFVTGAAALMKSRYYDATSSELKDAICSGAAANNPAWNNVNGENQYVKYGCLDVAASFGSLRDTVTAETVAGGNYYLECADLHQKVLDYDDGLSYRKAENASAQNYIINYNEAENGENYYSIMTLDGKYLAAGAIVDPDSEDPARPLVLDDEWSGADTQKWRIREAGEFDGETKYMIVNFDDCGFAIDFANELPELTLPTYSDTQKFFIKTSVEGIIPDDTKALDAGFFEDFGSSYTRIPDTVETISEDAFEGANLKSVTVDDNNPYFASKDGILYDRDMKEVLYVPHIKGSVKLPDSVEYIGAKFSGCDEIDYIELSRSLKFIEEGAFTGCTKLFALKIYLEKDGIDVSAFENAGLETTSFRYFKVVRNGGTTYFDGVFYDAVNIKYVPSYIRGPVEVGSNCNGIERSGSYGIKTYFSRHECLESISLPYGTEYIPEKAFMGCTSLKDVKIPRSVTSIRKDAFLGCTSLKKIVIPKSVVSIGDGAFGFDNFVQMPHCRLEDVYYEGTEEEWNNVYIGQFNLLGGATVHFGADTCECIGHDYTYDFSIDDPAADGTYTAYRYCQVCGERTDEAAVMFWSQDGVYYNDEYWEDEDDPWNYTLKLNIYPIEPETLRDGFMAGDTDVTEVEIKQFGRHGYPDYDLIYSQIGNSVFEGCTSLTKATLPSKVMTLGECAFKDCESLEEINFPAELITIFESAFENCSSLKSADLSGSKELYYIRPSAFKGCSALENVTFPDTVKNYYDDMIRISDEAFANCTSLKEITIPESVYVVGQSAFSGCTALETADLSRFSGALRNYAFSGCTSLKTVSLSGAIKYLGTGAFSGCTSLTDIYYEGSEDMWNSIRNLSACGIDFENVTVHFGSRSFCHYAGYHNFGDFIIVKQPTLTAAGSRGRRCSECGATAALPIYYNLGDTDGDGSVDLKDVRQIKKLFAGSIGQEYAVYVNCDINGDGEVDMKDIGALKHIVAG